jgi:hypothetical protein
MDYHIDIGLTISSYEEQRQQQSEHRRPEQRFGQSSREGREAQATAPATGFRQG